MEKFLKHCAQAIVGWGLIFASWNVSLVNLLNVKPLTGFYDCLGVVFFILGLKIYFQNIRD